MSFHKKWRPSKTAAKEYAQKMNEIDDFCHEHGITQSRSSDSYYFTVNGVRYRVSNHTIQASDRGMYEHDPISGLVTGQKRESYHDAEYEKDLICITAGKTRIVEIYKNLVAGKRLDKRGNVLK